MKNVCLIMIIMLLSVIVGCTAPDQQSDRQETISQTVEVPELQLLYTINGDDHTAIARSVATDWGTSQNDRLPALDAVGHMLEIKNNGQINEINIVFTTAPDSYSIKRWSDRYAGETEANLNNNEVVEINADMMTLPLDQQGYIYEVCGLWPQGEAYYNFYIK